MSDHPTRFRLIRHTDVTGASGTGHVADGVQWPDGTATIRWRGDRPSTVNWDNITHAKAIHGHGGATVIEWTDTAEGRLEEIASAHSKHVTAGGMTSGECNECGHRWPCPTNVWATTDRDPVLNTWDPADDEEHTDV